MTRTTYIEERAPLFWSVSPAKRAEISDTLYFNRHAPQHTI